MLSIGVIKSLEYYLSLTGEGYYRKDAEEPGRWLGVGAERLGLTGTVTRPALEDALRGVAPDGRRVQNAGKANRRRGTDLTLSADKTVSLFRELGDDYAREQAEKAHEAAVDATVCYLEDAACYTRRSSSPSAPWERIAPVFAAFRHSASREGDPTLHTHILCLNLGVRRTDGRVGAVASKPFYLHKMAAGALYRAELSRQLQERLGVAIERNGALFRVRGVPESVCRAFSKRRVQIEAAMHERGIISAAGAAAVTLATRKTKQETSPEVLRARWRQEGEALGFTATRINALLGEVRPHVSIAPPDVSRAVTDLLVGNSHFRERDLLRYVAERAPGTGQGAQALRDAVREHLAQNEEIVPIGTDRYTTREILSLEKEIVTIAQDGRSETRHQLSPRITADAARAAELSASERQGKPVVLNPEQRAALEHITTDAGAVKLVAGMAGTGKTFLLDAMRQAYEAAGYQVIGAALAGKAAQGLQDGAGITSSTLTRLLMDLDQNWRDTLKHHAWQMGRALLGKSTWGPPERITLTKNTVVVIDEAAMIGSRMLHSMMKAVQKAGCKLLLVGDAAQLQSIEVGGAFKSLQSRLDAAELKTIVRQKEQWARDAVMQFATGRADLALQEYARRGLFHVAKSRAEASAKLIADWKTHGLTRPEECLIFTATRSERDYLNRLAQDERRKAGKVGFLPLAINGTRFHIGDRVTFTKNSKLFSVQNGTMGTLLSLDPIRNVARFRLDAEGGAKQGKTVSVALGKYNAIELGYASTVHRAQGISVNRAFVMASSVMTDRELTYVQMSRSKLETRLYADEASLGADGGDFVRAMQTSRQKEMAIDIVAAAPPVEAVNIPVTEPARLSTVRVASAPKSRQTVRQAVRKTPRPRVLPVRPVATKKPADAPESPQTTSPKVRVIRPR